MWRDENVYIRQGVVYDQLVEFCFAKLNVHRL